MQRVMAVIVVVALAAAGCTQSETVAVTGTVSMNGKPVDQAEVMFHPKKEGRLTKGVTNAEGRFTLSTVKLNDGAMPGEYAVTLGEDYPPDKPPKPPPGGGFLPSRFPMKYANPDTSPLRAKVERGKKNDFPLDVKP